MTSAAPFDVSIVTAVYDVARYLPEFFASLEAQEDVDLARIQVVAVDDGSCDGSLELIRGYQQAYADRGILPLTVLHQENAGQGEARNHGMRHATGTWLTFTDPDDTLAPDYLAQVLRFVAAHPETELVATARIMVHEDTGRISDNHPLGGMFRTDRLVDLDLEQDLFHGSAPAAFFRRARVAALGLTFDGRVRPNFEDGHFCCHYLLGCPTRKVAFLKSARYMYRKRADGTGTMQRSVTQPERYTVVPRAGYLDVLQQARARLGAVPEWLQNYVVYELSWLFNTESSHGGIATAATGEVGRELVRVLREIRALLDPRVIEQFRTRRLDPAWRQILQHGLSDEAWRSPYAVMDHVDRQQNLARVVVRWTGPEPRIEYRRNGTLVDPHHTKIRPIRFFNADLLHERISWVPADGTLRVRVDGTYVEFRRRWAEPVRTTMSGPSGTPGRTKPPSTRRQRPEELWRTAARRVLTTVRRRAFADAWVLMDRLGDADDNAERLFEHLRENRPDINAWFVIRPGTPDHLRLREGPYRDRVVAHGSLEWEVLMLSCRHLVSSHIDVPVQRPAQVMRLLGAGTPPPWRFTFLQHGVIKDDLSGWLNSKTLDLFVTSTPDEYESVLGDRSQYVFTSREVKLTGLPRFDRLRRIAASLDADDRRTVLVAPTWRQWLQQPSSSSPRGYDVVDGFTESDYVTQWLGLLRSPELAETLEAHGLTLGFLPHPNLQHALPRLDLPPHVRAFTFADGGVQTLFASAAVLVTDYSSMAFNAAYVDRPLVYFQFDHDRVMAGGHLGRAGYFDYTTHGFGPVARTLPDTVHEITRLVEGGCVPAPEHARRAREAFVLRDGRCCERVTAAIEALPRSSAGPVPRPPSQRSAPVAAQSSIRLEQPASASRPA